MKDLKWEKGVRPQNLVSSVSSVSSATNIISAKIRDTHPGVKPSANPRSRNATSSLLNFFGLFGVIALLAISCAPAPRHPLTAEEKRQDLEWVFNQYEKHYAPLQYKGELHGFDYEELKSVYLERAKQTRDNAEFYALLHEFVSEFADAHNSGSLLDAGLPGRHQVAYLGFDGVRVGQEFVVTKLLPTISKSSNFPIKAGMKITKVDGVPIVDYVRSRMKKFRDLGNDEANLTYLMSRIFTRSTLTASLPEKDTVELTVKEKNSASEKNLTLRWVRQDLFEFNQEQRQAIQSQMAKLETVPADRSAKGTLNFLELFLLGLDYLSAKTDLLASVYDHVIRQSPRFNFWDTFQFVDTFPTWGSENSIRQIMQADVRLRGKDSKFAIAQSAKERLESERIVPSLANIVDPDAVYPWYHRMERLSFGENLTVKRRVAYLRLDTFSPITLRVVDGEIKEADPVQEIRRMVAMMVNEEIEDLVIDLIDNGGGSLQLGLQLAQAFSGERINLPGIRFKLSEEWLDDFQNQSLYGPSPEERERAKVVYQQLLSEFEARPFSLSSEFSTETLAPHLIQPNEALQYLDEQGNVKAKKINIVLLVNEMCASMCDIFTAVMKDNGLAQVVGAQTMGAGGNVVNSAPHAAPNSHFTLSRTESLILRSNGKYLENRGVVPDIPVEVNQFALSKYEPMRVLGLAVLLSKYLNESELLQVEKLVSSEIH